MQLSYAGFTLGGGYRHQQANYQTPGGAGLAGGSAAGLAFVDMASLGEQTINGNGSFGNGRAMDIGLAYATGPYAVSFSYFNSEVQHCRVTMMAGATTSQCAASGLANVTGNDRIQMYQLSTKYKVGPGVDMLGAVGWADYHSQVPQNIANSGVGTFASNAANKVSDAGSVNSNHGFVVMTGLSLTF